MRQAGSIVKKRKRWYVVYRTPEKRQKWEGGFKTKGEAQGRLTEILGQIQTGAYCEPSSMAFSVFANLWLSGRINITTATEVGYESYMKRHINPVLGNFAIKDIRHSTIQNFIAELCQKKGRGGKVLAPNTIKKLVTMMHSLFKAAVKNNLIRINPAEDIELPKVIKANIQPPSKEEALAIFREAPTKTKAIFLLDALTGLRRGEILALKWKDIDWMNHELLVQRVIRKVKATDGVHKYRWAPIESTKGGRSRRVGLAPIAVAILQTVRDRLAEPAADDDFIFTRDGDFIDPEYFSKWIALPLIRKATNGKVTRFHDLRHFLASMLIADGADPKYIQDQLGHASITTTFDTYGHLMPQAKQQATKKLERSLFGGKATVRTLLEQLPENAHSETIN
jgi:integrase